MHLLMTSFIRVNEYAVTFIVSVLDLLGQNEETEPHPLSTLFNQIRAWILWDDLTCSPFYKSFL